MGIALLWIFFYFVLVYSTVAGHFLYIILQVVVPSYLTSCVFDLLSRSSVTYLMHSWIEQWSRCLIPPHVFVFTGVLDSQALPCLCLVECALPEIVPRVTLRDSRSQQAFESDLLWWCQMGDLLLWILSLFFRLLLALFVMFAVGTEGYIVGLFNGDYWCAN